MTTFFVPTGGRWSGGGTAVLDNFRHAAARHPEISFNGGDIAIVSRNFPSRGERGPFILIPQNAWAWKGPRSGSRERLKMATMCALSELAMRRAVGVIRMGPSIPSRGRCWNDILPNPLDQGFDAAEIESLAYGRPMRDPYFVSVGSLNSYRGMDFLIRAYARYRAASGGVPLHIVGGGNPRYVALLEELAAQQDGIHLHTEKVSRPEVIAWLRHAEAAVLPSFVEASPISLLEALAVQPNVLASDIPGHLGTVPAGSGGPVYFSHHRPDELVAMLDAVRVGGTDAAVHPLSRPDYREQQRRLWGDRLVGALHGLAG